MLSRLRKPIKQLTGGKETEKEVSVKKSQKRVPRSLSLTDAGNGADALRRRGDHPRRIVAAGRSLLASLREWLLRPKDRIEDIHRCFSCYGLLMMMMNTD